MSKSSKKQPKNSSNTKKEFKSTIPSNMTPKTQYNTFIKGYVDARNERISVMSKVLNPKVK